MNNNFTLRWWVNFSQYHIRSAVHQAVLSRDAEERYKKHPQGNPFYSHRAYVTGCIFSCVAFLEATINEVFYLTLNNVNIWDPGDIDKETYKFLGSIWKRNRYFSQNLKGKIILSIKLAQRYSEGFLPNYKTIQELRLRSTLDKYQFALLLLGRDLFERGRLPYQDVFLLIKLRNNLIHHQPQLVYVAGSRGEDTIHEFEKKFSNKFSPSPIGIEMGRPYYPDQMLGFGCAKWSSISSMDFVSQFNSRIGIEKRYKDLFAELRKELPDK